MAKFPIEAILKVLEEPKQVKEDKRDYGSSGHTGDKYKLFAEWHLKAAYILKYKFPNRLKVHIDLTAGPYFDDKGDRNVLAGAVRSYQKAEVWADTVCVAIESDRARYDRLVSGLRSDGVLAPDGYAETGKVVAVCALFSDVVFRPIVHGACGEACFDPTPGLKACKDAVTINKIVPRSFSISSYIGVTIHNRMAKAESVHYGRDGHDRTAEKMRSALQGARKYGHKSAKYGRCGGQVNVFTDARSKIPRFFPLGAFTQHELFP